MKTSNLLDKLNAERFREERKRQKLSQLALAVAAKHDERHVRRIESGQWHLVSEAAVLDIAKALGKPIEFFFKSELKVLTRDEHRALQAEATQIAQAICAAGEAALNKAAFALRNPHRFPPAQTDPSKVNPSDKSKLADIVCGEAIAEVLSAVARNRNHVLSDGYYWIPEEREAAWIPGLSNGAIKLRTLIADEADDTPAFATGLGGTVLLACHKAGVGWIAAMVADFARRRLYYRVFGASTVAVQLDEPNPHHSLLPNLDLQIAELHGRPFHVSPSTTETLADASVNLYLGKANRVLDTARIGEHLLTKNRAAIHSHGGSLGPVLVADGSIDAAVEFVKGFKRIDLIPGLFIAHGAGAKVFLLTEDFELSEFDFGPDSQLAEIVKAADKSERVESIRQRFVVAATTELAEEIAERLRKHIH